MHRAFAIFVLTVCLSLSADESMAQTFAPRDSLRLAIDVARFRGPDDSTTTVELYYGFPERALSYVADSAGLTGALDCYIVIRQKDSIVLADRWRVPHIIIDTSRSDKSMTLTGVYKFALNEGEYDLSIVGRDRRNVLRKDSLFYRFSVHLAGTSNVALSDLELSSSIRPEAEKGPFYKNTFEVIPNASGIFGDVQPCFLYAETYNLLAGTDRTDYTVRLTVFDALNKQVISRDKIRKRAADATVIVDNVGVHRLHSGTYTVVLSILDTSGKSMAASGKKFYVYNPRLGIDSSFVHAGKDLPLGMYMGMEEPELDREFRWIRYEASGVEQNQFKQLTGIDAKRKFLSDFWRRREPDKREEYMGRVTYVNNHFASMGKEGYRTDRGRVYIMYGPPDDIERHPNESDKKPYEIWSFHNIQGGVIFVFVQRNQGSDFELVHSTHRDELHDENWDRSGITQ